MTGRSLTSPIVQVPPVTTRMENNKKGKTNMNIESNIYKYTGIEEGIKKNKVPEKLMDDRFICQPVSIEESTIKQKESTDIYGVDCVQFLDQIVFESDKEED